MTAVVHGAGPRRGRAPRYVGWVPFLCVLAAIGVLAAAGISWVTSPYWQNQPVTQAVVRNVGSVPVKGGAVVDDVSPNRIDIPKLKAEAPIVPVGTVAGGALDIPLNPKVVGWWDSGPEPGAAKGTAILAGHINYAGVEGTLATINTLDPGDTVYVYGLRDGKQTRLTFRITGVRTYDKKNLPYKQIFSQSVPGRLVIVTCGGPFDAATGNYLDNIVAYAVAAT